MTTQSPQAGELAEKIKADAREWPTYQPGTAAREIVYKRMCRHIDSLDALSQPASAGQARETFKEWFGRRVSEDSDPPCEASAMEGWNAGRATLPVKECGNCLHASLKDRAWPCVGCGRLDGSAFDKWEPRIAPQTVAAPAAQAEEFEVRADGVRVRKDRWEWAIRRIVALLWGNRRAFEMDDVVEAVRKLAPERVNEDDHDDEGLVAAAERGFAPRVSAAPAAVSGEAVARVVSWTNGSYVRNYKLEWLRDVPADTLLYAAPTAEKAERPADDDDDDDPAPTKGTTAIVDAWNNLPNDLRLSPHLIKLFEAVKTCRDVESTERPAMEERKPLSSERVDELFKELDVPCSTAESAEAMFSFIVRGVERAHGIGGEHG